MHPLGLRWRSHRKLLSIENSRGASSGLADRRLQILRARGPSGFVGKMIVTDSLLRKMSLDVRPNDGRYLVRRDEVLFGPSRYLELAAEGVVK